MKLLERAQEKKQKLKEPSQEELELAIAWINGEISNNELCYAIKSKHTGCIPYVYASRAIRGAIENKKINKIKQND